VLLRVIAVLLGNAVPVLGVLYRGWSPATVLTLFWCETMLQGLANTARILFHRRLTRQAGHWQGSIDVRAKLSEATHKETVSYLVEYTRTVFVFSLAHALFLFVFMAALRQNADDPAPWVIRWSDLRQGIVYIGAVALAELLVDAVSLRDRPFTWLKAKVEASYGRVFVLHLGIIFGMMAVAATSRPFVLLLVIIGLKTVAELLGAIYGREALPERMPRWFAAAMRKAGKKDPQQEWERMRADERRKQEAWNQPLPAPPATGVASPG